MMARPVSYSVVSRNCPTPDFCRSDSAIRMPIAAYSPVEMSTSGTPMRIGRLDLDHVGAVVGEDLRAVGSAEHTREIDHAQSAHRAGSVFSRHGHCLRSAKGAPSTPLSITGACSQMPGRSGI